LAGEHGPRTFRCALSLRAVTAQVYIAPDFRLSFHSHSSETTTAGLWNLAMEFTWNEEFGSTRDSIEYANEWAPGNITASLPSSDLFDAGDQSVPPGTNEWFGTTGSSIQHATPLPPGNLTASLAAYHLFSREDQSVLPGTTEIGNFAGSGDPLLPESTAFVPLLPTPMPTAALATNATSADEITPKRYPSSCRI